MKPAQREREVKLHTATDGTNWLMEPGLPARRWSEETGDIASTILPADVVYVVGAQQNSSLICMLHTQRHIQGSGVRIMLGPPSLIPPGPLVETVFACMEGQELPASLGGWHAMTEKDYVTHAMISALVQSGGRVSNYVETLLRAHPAWPAISFLSDHDKGAAIELITTIVDPRWHIDPQGPDSCAKLRTFMGVGSGGIQNVRNILHGADEADDDLARHRARVVLNTWTGGSYVPPLAEDTGPREFLWRIQSDAGKVDGVRGMFRACHAFLRFVKYVWLDNMTTSRCYELVTRKLGKRRNNVRYRRMIPDQSYAPELFVPRHFFRLEAEVAAWEMHLTRLG